MGNLIIKRVQTRKPLEFTEVTIEEPLVKDEEEAYKISGQEKGYDFQCALIAQVCKFDGKKLVMEDIKRMKRDDFLELMGELYPPESEHSETTASECKDTDTSKGKKSSK